MGPRCMMPSRLCKLLLHWPKMCTHHIHHDIHDSWIRLHTIHTLCATLNFIETSLPIFGFEIRLRWNPPVNVNFIQKLFELLGARRFTLLHYTQSMPFVRLRYCILCFAHLNKHNIEEKRILSVPVSFHSNQLFVHRHSEKKNKRIENESNRL